MYWCCIFLIGEWANVDFTYPGSRLCIFYVFFGIGIFSIPTGILVEAAQNFMQEGIEERKVIKKLMMDCKNDADVRFEDNHDDPRGSLMFATKEVCMASSFEAERSSA